MGDLGSASGTSSVLSWLPWAGLIVVAGVVGGSLGPLGLLGHNTTTVVAGPTTTALLNQQATAYACIGGAVAGRYDAGERVLAVERSEDGAYLGVRDPGLFATVVWVKTGEVVLDGDTVTQNLPVGGLCPVVSTVLASPPPAVVDAPVPPVVQPPAPTPDTTPPTIGTPAFALVENCHFRVTVSASDDRGVASVVLSWVKNGGGGAGSASMTLQGGVWVFDHAYAFNSADFGSVPYTFTAVALDAANHSTQSATANGTPQCLG